MSEHESVETMTAAMEAGEITNAELEEWLSLTARLKELQDLADELRAGEPTEEQCLTQSQIAIVMGCSQQNVAAIGRKAVKKLTKDKPQVVEWLESMIQ